MEKDIVTAILRHLKTRSRCFAWKTHGGMYGTAGIPDIIACVDGRFYAFEVKQPGGRLTRLQEATLGKIQAAGGVAVKVTSVEEVKAALSEENFSVMEEQRKYLRDLNRKIDEKLTKAAQLCQAGRFEEWTRLDREITRDIDRYVDMQRAFGCPSKEVFG